MEGTMTTNGNQTAEKDSKKTLSIEPAECRLGVHSFSERLMDRELDFHVTKMKDSFMLWIGGKPATMTNLAVAINTKFDSVPSSSMLMGDVADMQPTALAQRLAKATGKQVFVSCSLPLVDRTLVSLVEKRITEELKAHPDRF